MTHARQLRQLISSTPLLQCMGAHDPLSARLVQQTGFDVIYLGGFAAAASMLGLPDLGLLTLPEMADHIRRVAAVTDRPIIVDADNGHGSALNVRRTIAAFEAAGASGVHMEDQSLPKRCGHLAGKSLISATDMVHKVKAARAGACDTDFFIIARTDAIAVTGLDDALNRVRLYSEAGADALFLDAPESMEHLERIGRELKGMGKPLVFNAASTGKTPTLTLDQCRSLGFGIVLYPIEAMLGALHGARSVMQAIRADGNLASVRERMMTFGEIKDVLGFAEAEDFQASHPSQS
jgi:2-methylisocitrate lyase-like PEP mutase family enzyme